MVGSACEVEAVSCELVEVTAADRAAATSTGGLDKVKSRWREAIGFSLCRRMSGVKMYASYQEIFSRREFW